MNNTYENKFKSLSINIIDYLFNIIISKHMSLNSKVTVSHTFHRNPDSLIVINFFGGREHKNK